MGRREGKIFQIISGTMMVASENYLCVQVLYSNEPYNVFKEFVWDPTEPVATRPLVFRYAPNSLNLFYAFDGNKNVSDVFYRMTSNGIGAHYDYAPFGNTTRTHRDSSASFDIVALNPFRFSSEYYDSELDLVYYNYRHYSPSLGRFLSRDPIEEQGGINLYAFVRNAPTKTIDLYGQAEPSLGRHIGPDWLRKLLGVPDEDLTEWFFSRFPNALEFAKSKMRETLSFKICANSGASTIPNNSTTWAFGADDFAKYGDKNMSLYEEYLLMGHFSVRTKDIAVTWANKCEFSWKATFYLEDQTGSTSPSLKDKLPAFLYDLVIHSSSILTYIFWPRTVIMGEWEDSGSGCCPRKESK